MKDRLNAPIEYNALHRGFYYSEPNYRIPAGYSSADDLLALGIAKVYFHFIRTRLYMKQREVY